MQSPLHERLEYLVTYSSQLIFVSGDSVAQQQKTLDAFVFNQNDDTDIAYLTAKPTLELHDYRRLLCQQLLGQQVGSYVRPLNELMADLNQHHGPVLITITQAEHMPDALLQELWDLVLQSRFASNKQHLNVLLFGQSDWAEQAKQWLPAKNTNTPLLISSQSVMAQQVGSELDQLISQRRQAFQARLDERSAAQHTVSQNRLKSPWFWGIAVLLFLLCFTALIAWQYSSELEALFSPIEKEAAEDKAPLPTPGSAYRELVEQQPADVNDETLNKADSSESIPEAGKSQADTSSATTDDVTSAQARITDWQSAVQQMNEKRMSRDNEVSAAQDNTVKEKPSDVEADVKPVPVIDAEFATSMIQRAREANTAITANTANTTAPESKTDASDTLDNQTLLSLLTPKDYVIQLAGLKDAPLLRDFINDHKLEDKVWIYQTQRYGGPWYVLLFKQPFGSVTEARQAMSLLPEYPGKSNAFVKAADQVLAEIKDNS
ncbi:cell division protein DamX [Salinimonas sp. HHU 13199]|uniref:Cell division protein DamX n=1 Tax=Salinimonas profundi TaxID=2729140 RepID=A0ABR8LKV8_9ALTE|nr:SPOR domain-containing protein [Salinimonas profundi]MBD3586832.1 cell division protein DamX [Salinimonas profundi]